MSTRTTRDRDRAIEHLRQQLAAAETEKKTAEKAELAELRRLQKVAGEAHSRTILTLYDLLHLEAEHPATRTVNGQQRRVAVDRDEIIRTERLLTMVEGLIEAAGTEAMARLRQADQVGRDERKPKPRLPVEPVAATSVEEHQP